MEAVTRHWVVAHVAGNAHWRYDVYRNRAEAWEARDRRAKALPDCDFRVAKIVTGCQPGDSGVWGSGLALRVSLRGRRKADPAPRALSADQILPSEGRNQDARLGSDVMSPCGPLKTLSAGVVDRRGDAGGAALDVLGVGRPVRKGDEPVVEGAAHAEGHRRVAVDREVGVEPPRGASVAPSSCDVSNELWCATTTCCLLVETATSISLTPCAAQLR